MPIRKTPTNSNYQAGALLALTSRTIFSAASNTTGIKIHSGSVYERQATDGFGHFVIATSAPSTMADGFNVSKAISYQSGASNFVLYSINDDIFVPSGYGLYWISTTATAAGVGTATDVSWSAA